MEAVVHKPCNGTEQYCKDRIEQILRMSHEELAAYDRRVTERINKLEEDTICRNFENSLPPSIYNELKNCRFDNYKAENEYQKKASTQILNEASNIASGKHRFIVLCGKSGIGKSHLMVSTDWFIRHSVKGKYNDEKFYYSAMYVLSDEMASDFKKCDSFTSGMTKEEVTMKYTGLDVLLLDEFGKFKSPYEVDGLFRIINAMQKKSLIIGTNMDKPDFEKYITGAIQDRLNASGIYISLDGIESYRPKLYKENNND